MSSYMLMGKQMILTILIVSLTFGTETKLQIVSVQLRSSAYRTFMSGDSAICILMSVSYTHLDVYKRQTPDVPAAVLPEVADLPES